MSSRKLWARGSFLLFMSLAACGADQAPDDVRDGGATPDAQRLDASDAQVSIDAGTRAPACDPVVTATTACGGALGEGRWTVHEACWTGESARAFVESACPSLIRFAVTDLSVSGELVVTGTSLERDLRYAISYEAVLPPPCVVPYGGCTEFGQMVQAAIPSSDGTFTCAADGEGLCACVAVTGERHLNDRANLRVEGNVLALEHPDASVERAPFCARDDGLLLRFVDQPDDLSLTFVLDPL